VVSYAVMPGVPRELVLFVSGLLAARRRQVGTRKGTRRLGCYKQALFGLAWFRDKGDIRRLGAGFGLPQSTAYTRPHHPGRNPPPPRLRLGQMRTFTEHAGALPHRQGRACPGAIRAQDDHVKVAGKTSMSGH
jgi:hypothetical protein